MAKALVSILIPTYNNRGQLIPLLRSIVRNTLSDSLMQMIVINNGEKNSLDDIKNIPATTLIDSGKNLGWEGGLKLGLEKTDSEYVMFLNDDTYIPDSSSGWLQKMLHNFVHKEVGAVGPISNTVMGMQNMITTPDRIIHKSSFLIGFCMLLKRSILMEVGGIDDTLPGGDDLDLSIRLDNHGYLMLVDRNVFVYHYGFQTGTRIYGDYIKKGGWNSQLQTEQTNFGLIRKHGFIRWWECLSGITRTEIVNAIPSIQERTDTEGDIIRKLIKGERVYEFGCGGQKTTPEAIGFDLIPKGHIIDSIGGTVSVADECLDVSKPFPERIKNADVIIARHILEHCIDLVFTLKNWKKILKPEGKLIIAVPNQELFNTIPVNIEHVHAFTPATMQSLMEIVGFKNINIYDSENGISFVVEATNI